MSSIILGGPEAKAVRVHGDLTYSIEHVNDQESVCIWRTNRAPGNGALILGITVLGLYFDSTGLPSAEGIRRVKQASQIMGFSPMDTFATRHILDVIYLAIDDVIKLAPKAAKALDLTGVEGLTLRANGDVVMKH